jgi:hypothetical protein
MMRRTWRGSGTAGGAYPRQVEQLLTTGAYYEAAARLGAETKAMPAPAAMVPLL